MHMIDPLIARDAMGAALGTFVFLTATRRPSWLQTIAIIIVGQATAFYFVMRVAEHIGWSMADYPTIAFVIGALAMLFWGAVIKIAQGFYDDPRGLLRFLMRLRRGVAGALEDDDGKKDSGT